MKTDVRHYGDRTALHFEHDEGDRAQAGKAHFAGGEASVWLNVDEVHPDLEALALLVLCLPFSGRTISLRRPVSSRFATAVATHARRTLTPVDRSVAPRSLADGPLALAMGRGPDSFAALAVMPPETVPVHVAMPGAGATIWTAELGARLAGHGRDLLTVESDIELLRQPNGFSTDWASGVAAILLAERHRFAGIGWGVVAEQAYRLGHERWADWAERRQMWASIFAAAGLELVTPLAGVSEVGSSIIASRAQFADVASICRRDDFGPCRSCWRCLRRLLVEAALAGSWPTPADLDRMLVGREVRRQLVRQPMPNENVVAWLAARYGGDHQVMRLLAERTAEVPKLDLAAWYRPSAELISARFRAPIESAIDAVLPGLSEEGERAWRAWDIEAIAQGRHAERAARRIAAELGTEAPAAKAAEAGLLGRLISRGRG